MRTILVPLDGSAPAECALPYARALAHATGATLLLAQVVLEPGADADAWDAAAMGAAGRYLAAVRSSTPAADAVETLVEQGPAAEILLAVARARAVDLIVMTAHGHGSTDRAVGGPVARAVLAASPAPVLFVRAGRLEAPWLTGDRSRILVPLDGSRRAEAALPVALDLGERLGGELILVAAVGPQGELGDPEEEAEELALAAEAWTYLYKMRHRLADAGQGPAPVVDVRIASPVDAVVEACRDHRATLVVMATHGRLEAEQPLIGSVAEGLLRHGDTPLFLVPPSVGEVKRTPR